MITIHRLSNHKVIALSVREGTFFMNEGMQKHVENNSLIYLQIKSSLMTRLPFLDDLSAVVFDLKKLIDGPCEDYVIIVDRPELFLLSPSNDNKTATILSFGGTMKNNFKEVHYLSKKPATPFEQPAINEMAKLLVTQF